MGCNRVVVTDKCHELYGEMLTVEREQSVGAFAGRLLVFDPREGIRYSLIKRESVRAVQNTHTCRAGEHIGADSIALLQR